MKWWHLAILLVAGTMLFAPTAHAQFETDSYLTYDTDTWDLYGYSYTAMPWNDVWELYVESDLECCELDDNSTGPFMAYYVEADVSAHVNEAGIYYVQGDHWYVEPSGDLWDYIGESYYEVDVEPLVPTGEATGEVTELQDHIGAHFELSLLPAGTAFDGGTVKEEITGFFDGCSAQWGGYRLNPPTATSGTVGYEGNYYDEIYSNVDWLDQYEYWIATYDTGSCGWGFNQTMTYTSGSTSVDYAWNYNGQNIVAVDDELQTFRGSASFIYSF
jgi:hypothetical protein